MAGVDGALINVDITIFPTIPRSARACVVIHVVGACPVNAGI